MRTDTVHNAALASCGSSPPGAFRRAALAAHDAGGYRPPLRAL